MGVIFIWMHPQLPFLHRCRKTRCEGKGSSRHSREVALNQQVKDLIQKLGEAIHESMSESEQIAGVVRDIRKQGFDVLLMLEATIGLNEIEEDEAETADEGDELAVAPFTRNDLTFLKSLRITTEEHLSGSGNESSDS
jgi:hypothetical protein